MKSITPDHIYIIGDVHGDYNIFHELSLEMKPNSIFIQVGDFGKGFKNSLYHYELLKEFTNKLEQTESECLVIRGNHDNPEMFHDQTEDRITFLKDYTYMKINDETWLFVGGATSIDRYMRRENINWWSEEAVNYDPDKCQTTCDVLILHGAPASCEPVDSDAQLKKVIKYYTPNVGSWSKDMFVDLRKERQILERIMMKTKPSFLYYGHFHYSHEEKVNGCHCTLLNIKEVKKHL